MDMAKDDDLKKQNKVSVSATINPELVERLEAFCEKMGYVRARVVEKAIEQYLDKEERKK